MLLRGDFSSDLLRTKINMQFIVPEHFDAPYRVVYLLHGLHGNQGSWTDNSMLPLYSKKYNAVFVMPEAGRSFYFDLKYGRKYFTFISDELPKIVKNTFNISSQREDTAVIGYSMGGNGALKLALSKPEQYGFCGAISAACIYFGPVLDNVRKNIDSFKFGDAIESEETLKDIKNYFSVNLEYDLNTDIPNLSKIFSYDKTKLKIYSACGIEDSLRKENLKLNEDMKNAGFDFTYEEWQGNHEWDFFNEALKKTLAFWYKQYNGKILDENQFAGDA